MQQLIAQFEREADDRKCAESALQLLNETLELRVNDRTWKLIMDNEKLKIGIKSRKVAEKAQFTEKERALVTLQSIADAIITTDTAGCVTYLNPVAEKMTEWTNTQAYGLPSPDIFKIIDEETREPTPDPVQRVLKSGEVCTLENQTMLISRNNNEYPIEDSAAPIRNPDGTLQGVVLIFHDASNSRKMSNKMSYLAQHDFLTDLPNRVMLTDRLNQAIQQAKRYGRQGALMFLDLDHFKEVNDTLGHIVGDQLLRTVATRLQQCVRKSDTVSRLGGDEFIILLPEIPDSLALMEIAEKLLNEIVQPYMIEHHEIRVSTSIGIVLFPQDGNSADILTQNADTAMYHAKAAGRNNYQFFTKAFNEKVLERANLENSLRQALDNNELRLHYQPKYCLASGKITGAEALLRWVHPALGAVSPAQFIPAAEASGMIGPIGRWVIEEASRQNLAWQKAGLPALPIAVNLSPVQLRQVKELNEITNLLAHSKLDLQYLEFEITESVALQGEESTIRWLKQLKEMGIGLTLDDFGTGYSSLSYLKRFPIDAIKIDKSFVRNITTDPDDAAIIQAIIGIGHNLGFKVIAEGIETTGQLDFLKAHGCDQGQGYLFSQPLPAEEFEQLLAAIESKTS